MSISEKRLNNIFQALEKKVFGKVDKEDILEKYLPTDEQMNSSLQKALEYIDNYEAPLTETLQAALIIASKTLEKGFMLPAYLSDRVSQYFMPDEYDSPLLLTGTYARSSAGTDAVADQKDGKAAVEELKDYLKQHRITWYSAKVHPLRKDPCKLVVGLRHRDIENYDPESVNIPKVVPISKLEIGKVKDHKITRASKWITVTIELDKPLPSIDEIGICISEDEANSNHLTLILEQVEERVVPCNWLEYLKEKVTGVIKTDLLKILKGKIDESGIILKRPIGALRSTDLLMLKGAVTACKRGETAPGLLLSLQHDNIVKVESISVEILEFDDIVEENNFEVVIEGTLEEDSRTKIIADVNAVKWFLYWETSDSILISPNDLQLTNNAFLASFSPPPEESSGNLRFVLIQLL